MTTKIRVCTVFGNDSELAQVKEVLLRLEYEEYSTIKPSNFDDRDNCIVCEVFGEENTKMFYFTKLNSNNVPQIPFCRFIELFGRKRPVRKPKEWKLDLRAYTICLIVTIMVLYPITLGDWTVETLVYKFGYTNMVLIILGVAMIIGFILYLLIPKNKKL